MYQKKKFFFSAFAERHENIAARACEREAPLFPRMVEGPPEILPTPEDLFVCESDDVVEGVVEVLEDGLAQEVAREVVVDLLLFFLDF